MTVVADLNPATTFLVRVAGSVVARRLLDLFDQDVEVATEIPVRKLVVEWQINDAGDTGTTSCHYLNITSGGIDDTWTAADFIGVENGWVGMLGNLAGRYTTGVGINRFTWYHPSLGLKNGKPIELSGEHVRSQPSSHRGTAATVGQLAPQSAVSVTLKTPSRRHWGRFFLPAPRGDILGAGGQLSAADTLLWRTSVNAMFKNGWDNGQIMPVVYSRTIPAVLGINQLQVDSITDVIRSRRPKAPNTRSVAAVDLT